MLKNESLNDSSCEFYCFDLDINGNIYFKTYVKYAYNRIRYKESDDTTRFYHKKNV